MRPRLVMFDCDGTLVDSQNGICAAMEYAFTTLKLATPRRAEVLSVIGLSLPQAFAVLAPEQPAEVRSELAELYRMDFPRQRDRTAMHDPLFAGMGEVVATLAKRQDILLGIATGKSRRGVARLLEREGWQDHFATIQTADDNPSKPHPSMILRAISKTGAEPGSTLMIGDTTYDMEMARSAGAGAVGVAWGYHEPERLRLAGADAVVSSGGDLLAAIEVRLAAREAGG